MATCKPASGFSFVPICSFHLQIVIFYLFELHSFSSLLLSRAEACRFLSAKSGVTFERIILGRDIFAIQLHLAVLGLHTHTRTQCAVDGLLSRCSR